MTDKKAMPVSGGGPGKGKPDGVSGTPDSAEMGRVNGRLAGGESSGGAYPSPHSGKEPDSGGFPGHGGQTEQAYYGGDNPNATSGSGRPGDGEKEGSGAPHPVREAHALRAGERTVEVVEEDGVAAAEATGKIATMPLTSRNRKRPGVAERTRGRARASMGFPPRIARNGD